MITALIMLIATANAGDLDALQKALEAELTPPAEEPTEPTDAGAEEPPVEEPPQPAADGGTGEPPEPPQPAEDP